MLFILPQSSTYEKEQWEIAHLHNQRGEGQWACTCWAVLPSTDTTVMGSNSVTVGTIPSRPSLKKIGSMCTGYEQEGLNIPFFGQVNSMGFTRIYSRYSGAEEIRALYWRSQKMKRQGEKTYL